MFAKQLSCLKTDSKVRRCKPRVKLPKNLKNFGKVKFNTKILIKIIEFQEDPNMPRSHATLSRIITNPIYHHLFLPTNISTRKLIKFVSEASSTLTVDSPPTAHYCMVAVVGVVAAEIFCGGRKCLRQQLRMVSPRVTAARTARDVTRSQTLKKSKMSLRRLLSAVRSAREAITRGAPIADGLLKSLVSLFVIVCIAVSSPPSASAKPFALSFPAGWSLAGLVGTVGARAEDAERREPAGVKPYTGRRVGNDTLRMIYFHDQTVAVVELGEDKLLLNCELIETIDEEDTERLLRQLSVINRPFGVSFPQMVRLMGQCQQVTPRLQVEGVEGSESAPRASAWREPGAARARLDAGGAHAGLLGGSPLTLLQGIIPGTKWCGTGDIAADYHDLGADRRLDRCCRTHDLCPTKVRAFSRRYNLTNNSLYSKSHCTCDDMLFDCLKATNTSASHLMGHIYFNLVQVPCLEDLANGRSFRDAKQGF